MKKQSVFASILSEIFWISLISLSCGLVFNLFYAEGILSLDYSDESQEMNAGEISLDVAFDAWKKNRIFLDVRTETSYNEGHIRNALLLPYFNFDSEISNLMVKLQGETQFIVYCSDANCNSSEVIYQKLKTLGLSQVRFFRGGYHEWVKAGYPTEASGSNLTN